MAIGLGLNAYIGFARETTIGTPVASTLFADFTKKGGGFKQQQKAMPSLRKVSQDRKVKTKKDVSISLEAQLGYEEYGVFFKDALGANTTTGAGPYTHTMSGGASLPVGLTIAVNPDGANVGTGSIFQYTGCQVQKLSLKQSMESMCMLSVDLVGLDLALINIETPTFPTFAQADWTQFALTFAGSAVATESFELTIDNTLATDRYKLGSQVRKGIGRAGVRKITGKVVLEFESLTEYNKYKGLTSTAIVATWTGTSKSLTVTMPACYFSGSDPDISDSGPIKLSLDFEAFQNAAEGDEISLVLINGVATLA